MTTRKRDVCSDCGCSLIAGKCPNPHFCDGNFNSTLAVFARLAADQKSLAERQWQARSKAPAPQQACDVGLFSDDSKQTELFTPATKGKES